jgi:hypothetical protein
MHDFPCGWDGGAGFKVVSLVSTEWRPIVEANSRRIALLFGPPPTLEYMLAFGPELIATGVGIQMENLGSPLLLSRHLHGGLVTRGWWGLSTAATLDITVMEAFAD